MDSFTSKSRFRYLYAVKFICTSDIPGTSQSTPCFPAGNYQTCVNILNPQDHAVKIAMKLASPLDVSPQISDTLKPCEVQRFSCDDIKKFEIHFVHGFEGFLVIESTHCLNVTAVYTAAGKDNYVASMNVEQIFANRC